MATTNATEVGSQGDQTEAAPAQPAPTHNSSLYVGDIDRDVSEAQLFELFAQASRASAARRSCDVNVTCQPDYPRPQRPGRTLQSVHRVCRSTRTLSPARHPVLLGQRQ